MWLWLRAAWASDAQSVRIEDYSLQDLLDLEVEAATLTALPGRETPSLVTVLTGDELVRLGARDLMDALRLLPALEPAVDVFGGVGFGVRGSWAFEGRCALIVDGVEWNELEWSTTGPMANRIPAWLIERIEVVRGPGSAVYGGTAELAVIEVTTKAGGDWTGAQVQGEATWLPSGVYGRRDVGAAVAQPLGQLGRVALQGHVGQGRASDDVYTDLQGNQADMTEHSAQHPAMVGGQLELGPAQLSAGYHRYDQTHRDGYGRVLHKTGVGVDTELAYARAAAELPIGERASVEPQLTWTWSRPWSSREGVTPEHWLYANQWAHRLRGAALASVQASDGLALLGGAEGTWDRGEVGAEVPDFWLFSDGRRFEDYWNLAGFAQAVGQVRHLTLTAGVRVDVHSLYGAALAPRLALTRAWERAHVKVLASRAFRAPGLSLLRDEVGPEYAHTAELELGGGPTDQLYLTGSAWVTTVSTPLLYVTTEDEDGEVWEGFRNDTEHTGTSGGELELRGRMERAELVLGYAGYTARGLNGVSYFAVPGEPGPLLALPQHKVVARGSLELGPHVVVGPVATWLGPRHAFVRVEAGAPVAERLPSEVLLDLAVVVRDVGVEGLSLSLSGHDLLDSNPGFAQPYDGGHAPLPGPGRELGLQLGMRW
jgi:outer membrane receptor for ferrienterochelin and colicins